MPALSRRTDPIFGKQAPLLFAHRGGVKQVPQSTERAFRYALAEARADVLELDVQVVASGEIVSHRYVRHVDFAPLCTKTSWPISIPRLNDSSASGTSPAGRPVSVSVPPK